MRRIFRAFLWMRWRVLVNSLERTGSRDTLERFSVAAGKLGPDRGDGPAHPVGRRVLFVLGITAGFGTATGSMTMPMQVLRYLTLPRHRAHAPRAGRAADARRRQRDAAAPAADSANGALHGAGRRARSPIPWIALLVPAVARRRDRHGGRIERGRDHRGAGGGRRVPALPHWARVLASSADPPAAARSAARRPRDAGAGPRAPDHGDRAAVPDAGAADRRPQADAGGAAGAAAVAHRARRAAAAALRAVRDVLPRREERARRRRTRPCRWRASRSPRWASSWPASPRTAACSTCRRARGSAAPARSADCGTGSSPDSRPRRRPSRSRSCVSRCARRAAARRSDRRC